MSESKDSDSKTVDRKIIREDICFGGFTFYQFRTIEIPIPGIVDTPLDKRHDLIMKYDSLLSPCVGKFFNGGTYEGKIWVKGPFGAEAFTEKLVRILISCCRQEEKPIKEVLKRCLSSCPRLSDKDPMVGNKSMVIDAIYQLMERLQETGKYPQAEGFLTSTCLT